jgi:hypothetical protein
LYFDRTSYASEGSNSIQLELDLSANNVALNLMKYTLPHPQ